MFCTILSLSHSFSRWLLLQYDKKRVEAKKKKAKLYADLSREVFRRRREKLYDQKSLMLCAKLLELNCELYSLWNYRKEYLEPKLKAAGEQEEQEAKVLARDELKLVEVALQKNPKSYAAWQHRKWIISHKKLVDLDQELHLCNLLLSVDERNFHCWSYRRFVVKLSQTDPEDELDFTTEKILQNFSNYSSWHYRSALLPAVNEVTTLEELMKVQKETDGDKNKTEKELDSSSSSSSLRQSAVHQARLPLHVLQEEFKLVKEAFYTEPEDQSSWLYHRWLMSHLVGGEGRFGAEEVNKQVQEEIETCESIAEMEPNSKWPMLTLARLLELKAQREGRGHEQAEVAAAELKERVGGMYHTLSEVDHMRRGYYKDAATGTGKISA